MRVIIIRNSIFGPLFKPLYYTTNRCNHSQIKGVDNAAAGLYIGRRKDRYGMTKKDFVLIAAVIFTLDLTAGAREIVARAFRDKLKQENERFNPAIFMAAAGFPRYERVPNDKS